MDVKEFERRLEDHNGSYRIFRADATELNNLRNNVALSTWMDMGRDARTYGIPGAVAFYAGVLFVEKELGDLNKGALPFLASLI